ncbi:response regulator [Fluviispira vulneris]|uniref:response regulator n=1 Tax=Fluviispira vulneris TaxID=2763012 RepID=UPI001647C6FB|nr:response regulator [Fluviispira vulneris]
MNFEEMDISILIADDDEDIQKLLSHLLKKFSKNICEVSDGVAAKKELIENNYSIAIIDLSLPKVSGLEVLKSIKSYKLDTVIIVYTGEDNLKVIKECMRNGAFDFLEKQSDKIILEETVKRAIEMYHFLSDRKKLLEFIVCEFGNITIDKFRKMDNEKQRKIFETVQALLKLKIANKS